MEPKPKAHLFTFAVMALFIFVFLGSEYHFDIAYGELAGPDSVVGAQASILATSAIGLVGYSLVNRTAAARHRSILAGVLGTVSALAIQTSSEVLLGLIIFYLSSGFFVVFFTSSFLRIAMRCANSSLWAGMGRAANNACAALVAMPSMALILSGDIMLISSITIALAMVTLLVVHALENVRRTARHKAEIEAIKLAELTAAQAQTAKPQEEPEAKAPADKSTPEKHLAAFSEQYSLTPRERDVLSAVCSSEETLQCIADDMGISLRALQKHLTSIYRKSDTQSRAGLCSAALTEPLEH